jgi:uncharacterized SAM-binding protein YcdF (DUF218 family)
MYGILFLSKKIVSCLFNPLTIILILLAFGVFLLWQKKHKRAGWCLLSAGLFSFIIIGYGLATNSLLKRLEGRYHPLVDVSKANGARWVVVLGAGMTSDPKMPLTSQLSEGSTLRAVEGIRIWRQLKGAKLLFSGGAVFNTRSEASGMADLARSLGVPDSSICLEDKSLDTDDQARIVKEKVKGQKVVLVTSAAHMTRSAALFQKQGVDLIPAPAHFLVKDEPLFKPDRLFPNSGNIIAAETLLHEYLGLAWSRIRGKI